MKVSVLNPYSLNPQSFNKKQTEKKQMTDLKALSNPIVGYEQYAMPFGRFYASKTPKLLTELKSIPNLPCAYCGKVMLPCDVLNFHSPERETALEYSDKIINKVLEHGKNLMPVETNVLKIIEKKHRDNPNLTLTEIMRSLRPSYIQSLSKQQLRVFKNIEKLANGLPIETKEKIFELTSAARKAVEENDEQNIFKKKDFITKLKNIKLGPNYKKILEEAISIPSSKNRIDAFIVKHSLSTDFEDKNQIALVGKALLEREMMTVEHLRAQTGFSQDEVIQGKNSTANLVGVHRRCNENRGDISLETYLEKNPEIGHNIRRYINFIIKKINDGYLKNYRDYPNAIKNSLHAETKGVVGLDTSKLNSTSRSSNPKQRAY